MINIHFSLKKNKKKFQKKSVDNFNKLITNINKDISNSSKTLNILNTKFKFNFNLKDLRRFKKFNTVAIIGMGGSILGAAAIYDFLKFKIKKKFYFFDNLDQDSIREIKQNENLNKVLKRVVELGDTKKTMTAADLPIIITDVLETSESQRIELLNCSISSGLNLRAIATIHLKIDSKEFLETGSGNGGYDAFMSAIKKILKHINMKTPELVDYQIRIPRGGKSNALTEAIITWQIKWKRLQTIGIDSDQVIAAVNSTIKMLNLQILQNDISD